jgi:hypothetical protein
MDIKFIFKTCEDFFDSIYSQGVDNLHDDEKEVDSEDDEEYCCNMYYISKYILSALEHYKCD